MSCPPTKCCCESVSSPLRVASCFVLVPCKDVTACSSSTGLSTWTRYQRQQLSFPPTVICVWTPHPRLPLQCQTALGPPTPRSQLHPDPSQLFILPAPPGPFGPDAPPRLPGNLPSIFPTDNHGTPALRHMLSKARESAWKTRPSFLGANIRMREPDNR